MMWQALEVEPHFLGWGPLEPSGLWQAAFACLLMPCVIEAEPRMIRFAISADYVTNLGETAEFSTAEAEQLTQRRSGLDWIITFCTT